MAVIGFSAVLKVNDGTAHAMAAFASVVTIKIPTPEAGVAETTNLTSTNRIRTFIPSLLDPGMFDFSLRYSKADYVRLVALLNTTASWEIDAPPDSVPATLTLTFDAIVQKIEMDLEADKVVDMKVSAKIAGAVTAA